MGHNFAEINLWGTHIASVEWQPEKELAYFEYTQDFISSGIELSPLMMPLSSKIFSFPALARETFSGLPGLLADSLPDKFGNLLIDQWLSRQGRSKADFNPVERLCYLGLRAIGALEYKPNLRTSKKSESLELDYLVILANQVLRQKESLQIKSSEEQAIEQILQVGTSAGGARAKALIAWNSETDEVRSGQVDQDEGFSYWLLKFDGIDANSDKEAIDPKGYGLIEYAYYLMARDAGLDISESRLYEENGRQHFMTKRFDRSDSGAKLHQLSLMGMAHFDFNQVGAYSYEQVFEIIDKLNLGMASKEQFFRRMAFNIIARNQDDHVKNTSFLMNKKGEWKLAPAYDITYSYQPKGMWTGRHQLSLNAKRDDFDLDDFVACGKRIFLQRNRAKQIVKEVTEIVSQWSKYANQVGVDTKSRDAIAAMHRLTI